VIECKKTMHINLEAPLKNSITSYSKEGVVIDGKKYENNLVISANNPQKDWVINSLNDLVENESELEKISLDNPEVVIIGHNEPSTALTLPILAFFSRKGIGIEFMDIGAACRTYNILLSEGRNVYLGLILSAND
jgi:uncharacterized protein